MNDRSPLYRLNPTLKLISMLIIALAPALTLDPLKTLYISIASFTILAFSYIGIKRYLKILTLASPVIIGFTLFQIVIRAHAGLPLLNIGLLSITDEGLKYSFIYFLRIVTALNISISYAVTTEPKLLASSMISFKTPRIVAYTLQLSFTLLHIFIYKLAEIFEGLKGRGFIHNVYDRFRSLPQVSTILLAYADKVVNDLSTSMEVRGFTLTTPRTLKKTRVKTYDVMLMLAILAFTYLTITL